MTPKGTENEKKNLSQRELEPQTSSLKSSVPNEREDHHYYNETQTFTLTLRNPRSHATTRQGWLKTPGWAWKGCIQSLDWTSGLDWWTGLLDSVSFLFFFSFWHIFGQLVVAIATLNVKYAGEPVYLALSVILGLCAILSLGIISIVRLPFVLS